MQALTGEVHAVLNIRHYVFPIWHLVHTSVMKSKVNNIIAYWTTPLLWETFLFSFKATCRLWLANYGSPKQELWSPFDTIFCAYFKRILGNYKESVLQLQYAIQMTPLLPRMLPFRLKAVKGLQPTMYICDATHSSLPHYCSHKHECR